MKSQILTAFLLGLVGGVVPGPVLTAIFTEILQKGFLKSFRIIFWAVLTETVVALVSLLAFTSFHLPPSFFYGISIVGVGILIFIATQLWRIKSLDTEETIHFGVTKIITMILANGVLWMYWITVCIPKAMVLGEQINYGEFLFLILVEVGWLVSTASVAFAFSWFRRILSNPRVVPFIFKLFSIIFIYFALSMFYTSIVFFLT
jgi:threonine/homoserine/homoserine lactone efflux protein